MLRYVRHLSVFDFVQKSEMHAYLTIYAEKDGSELFAVFSRAIATAYPACVLDVVLGCCWLMLVESFM